MLISSPLPLQASNYHCVLQESTLHVSISVPQPPATVSQGNGIASTGSPGPAPPPAAVDVGCLEVEVTNRHLMGILTKDSLALLVQLVAQVRCLGHGLKEISAHHVSGARTNDNRGTGCQKELQQQQQRLRLQACDCMCCHTAVIAYSTERLIGLGCNKVHTGAYHALLFGTMCDALNPKPLFGKSMLVRR